MSASTVRDYVDTEPPAGTAPARTIRRRTPLPGPRALVGGFLVAASALGIFVAYSRAVAGPETRYVVARHDLPIGTRLTASDLTSLPMDLPEVVRSKAVFRSTSALVGATVIGPVRGGELVQAADVVQRRAGVGELEVSFAIESSRALGGTLRPGERVDVHATFGTGGETYTAVVVRQASVVAATGASDGLRSANSQTITLAVGSGDAALALSHAVHAGEVTLVRGNGAGGGPEIYRAPASEPTNRAG